MRSNGVFFQHQRRNCRKDAANLSQRGKDNREKKKKVTSGTAPLDQPFVKEAINLPVEELLDLNESLLEAEGVTELVPPTFVAQSSQIPHSDSPFHGFLGRPSQTCPIKWNPSYEQLLENGGFPSHL